jgi:hypothetical protein
MRFDTDDWVGNDGVSEDWGGMTPFLAEYDFQGERHIITVWERCWADAHRHANEHGMRIVGHISAHIRLKPHVE